MSKKNSVTKTHSNHNYLNTQKSNADARVNGNLVQLWFGRISKVLTTSNTEPKTLDQVIKDEINSPQKKIMSSKLVLAGLLATSTFMLPAFAAVGDMDDDNDGILDAVESDCRGYALNLSGLTTATPSISNVMITSTSGTTITDGTFSAIVDGTYTDLLRPSGTVAGSLNLGVRQDSEFMETTINFSIPTKIRLSQAEVNGFFDIGEMWTISVTGGAALIVDTPVVPNVFLPGGNAAELTNITGNGTGSVSFVPNTRGGHIAPANSAWSIATDNYVTSITLRYEKALNTGAIQRGTLAIATDCVALDTDNDGIFDMLDLDSDNDGISDLIESGQDHTSVDANNDGILDLMATPVLQALNDLNDDGVLDAVDSNTGTPVVPTQTDTDTLADYLDLDADNDGIPDAIEAQPTAGYTPATFVNNTANKGVNDNGLFAPENTDGADNPDYLDTDSDNDSTSDSAESGLTLSVTDANNDGIDDHASIGASYANPDGVINTPATDLTNTGGAEAIYRNVPPTTNDLTSATAIPSNSGPTNIVDLTGVDLTGTDDGTIVGYIIGSLPSGGTLFIADGTTLVTAGQVLTPTEAAGLKFDPDGTTNGDVTFTLAAIDNDGAVDASPATITISLMPPLSVSISVPTLSEWMLILLSMLLGLVGLKESKRNKESKGSAKV